jgi:hypothetical protein
LPAALFLESLPFRFEREILHRANKKTPDSPAFFDVPAAHISAMSRV